MHVSVQFTDILFTFDSFDIVIDYTRASSLGTEDQVENHYVN